jgi:hypothetical protein
MDRLFSARTKRIALVVLAVTLVALAGCSTGGNGGDATPTANQTTPEPTSEPTSTSTPEPTSTPTPEPTPEPNLTRDIDPGDLAESHTSVVDSASSLTVAQQTAFTQHLEGNTSLFSSSVSGQFNFEDSVGLQNFTEIQQSQLGRVGGTTEVYTDGNETFTRTNTTRTQQPQFNYGQEPYNGTNEPTPVNFTNVGWTGLYDSWNASLESQGETEFRNETVTEYRAEGTSDLPFLVSQLNDSYAEFDTVNATVLVTDDGLVTYTIIQMSGTDTNGGTLSATLQYSVTDPNTTTVPEPAWLDQVNTTG